jgi:hypothetical protein
MNRDLTSLKKQYDALGKEIEALENQSDQADKPCYKPGVLVYYSNGEITERTKGIGVFRRHHERKHVVNNDLAWKHIAPAPMPWLVWEGGNNPPVHPDQMVEVWVRERDTPNHDPRPAKEWNWRHDITINPERQIVAYRVVTTHE